MSNLSSVNQVSEKAYKKQFTLLTRNSQNLTGEDEINIINNIHIRVSNSLVSTRTTKTSRNKRKRITSHNLIG